MADLVCVAAVPHNPLLYAAMREPVPDDLAMTADRFDRFSRWLDDLAVDALVVIGSDHLRKFFHDNSPAFAVGKAPQYVTTYENEVRHFGLDSWRVPGDEELAGWLLGGAELPEAIDFALSNEWVLDHSYSVPLRFVRPAWDLPVVPVHTNTNIPPIPRASRFAALGAYLAGAVRAAPFERRVAILTTGHLATDIGGPKGFLGGQSPDDEFDRMAVGWMTDGDLPAAIAGCTLERMLEAGNVTPQFLNIVAGLAAAGGRAADFSEGTPSRFAAGPFFFWDLTA
jgi:protocatechuate 4,5-dioxygenase, beta chain